MNPRSPVHGFAGATRLRHRRVGARAAVIACLGCVVAPMLGGCQSSPSAPDAPSSGNVAMLQMPSVALAPAEETTLCITLPLGNDTPQMLRRIHSVIASGSHHLIAYRAPAGTPAQLTPTPCQPFADITNGISPVIIAESPDAQVVYPDGVGLPIEAHQMMKLEEHFINVSDAVVHSSGTVEFTLADPDPGLVAANLLFWGPQGFDPIAPHAAGTADYAHAAPAGAKVFGLTTHEHHFGTLATVALAANAGATATELYRNTDWEHPPLKSFDPPLVLDGTQELRVHCEWFNTSGAPVEPGLSAVTNEMCFFWAYYYPSQGFQICNEDGCEMQ
jgi:hypothetical protein